MLEVQALFEWLVEGTPGAANPVQAVQRLCDELHRLGMPLEHGEAFVRTLHPNIAGRSFLWRPGRAVEVVERRWEFLQSPAFRGSPMAEACERGEYVRRRPSDEPALASLAADGMTDFVAAPLRFLTGQNHVFTFATRAPGGFSDEEIAAIRRLMPPLARVAEIFALQRTATNLLSTYVGRNTGERILAGKIQLGDTETIRAVIWFSDLRGFTVLAQAVPPAQVIRALNELFGCQIPAIERQQGEVLKFIGDGLLAIFPISSGDEARARCDAALDAARESFERLAALNAARAAAGDAGIAFGVALHLGEISYGNIGGASRLDFTAIGPSVNLAARLEGVAARLARPIVVSEDFAGRTSRAVEPLGRHELKGVDGPQQAFAPRG